MSEHETESAALAREEREETERLRGENAELRSELARWRAWQPPGHFYSPLPDIEAVRRRADRIFHHARPEIAGIDLHLAEQIALADHLVRSYSDDYFPEHRTAGRRYYWRNEFFPFADAFYVSRFLHELSPRRIVEIGSGHSSAAMLDTADDLRAAGLTPPRFDFVEPYPERLRGLLRDDDGAHCRLWEMEVQDAPDALFDELRANDLVLVDSSHVLKTGSDLAHLFFHVLPRLAVGVYVFLHDVSWPFEYPIEWVEEGRAWNEAYFLRSFLMYNDTFALRWMPGLVVSMDVEGIRSRARLLIDDGASGAWIQRVR